MLQANNQSQNKGAFDRFTAGVGHGVSTIYNAVTGPPIDVGVGGPKHESWLFKKSDKSIFGGDK